MDEVTYRAAYKSEWDICMDLAWRTFLKFDAPDYPQEGSGRGAEPQAPLSARLSGAGSEGKEHLR